MRKWRIEYSEELYNINGRGNGYFSINDKGHVQVTPRKKEGCSVDLSDLIRELYLRDVSSSLLLLLFVLFKQPVYCRLYLTG